MVCHLDFDSLEAFFTLKYSSSRYIFYGVNLSFSGVLTSMVNDAFLMHFGILVLKFT